MENLQPEELKLIRLYVLDLASDEEKQAIETRMATNDAFAREVSVQRVAQMYQFTRVKDHLKALRDQMVADGDLLEEKQDLPLKEIPLLQPPQTEAEAALREPKRIIMWPGRVAAAASIVIMLGLGTWLWYRQPGADSAVANRGAMKPATPQPAPISPNAEDMVNGLLDEARQPLANVPGTLKRAARAFESQDTDGAIRLLQDGPKAPAARKDDQLYGASQETQAEKHDPVLQSYRKFYLGISYLAKGDAPKALAYLKEVKAPLEQEARWYTALAYLKNKEAAKARPILTAIRNDPASKYAAEANSLLHELQK